MSTIRNLLLMLVLVMVVGSGSVRADLVIDDPYQLIRSEGINHSGFLSMNYSGAANLMERINGVDYVVDKGDGEYYILFAKNVSGGLVFGAFLDTDNSNSNNEDSAYDDYEGWCFGSVNIDKFITGDSPDYVLAIYDDDGGQFAALNEITGTLTFDDNLIVWESGYNFIMESGCIEYEGVNDGLLDYEFDVIGGVSAYFESIVLIPPPPDLIITDLHPDPAPVDNIYYVGHEIEWFVTVNNNEVGSAGSSSVGYYLGTSPSDLSNRINSSSTGTLASGESETVSSSYTFTASDEGMRYLICMADCDGDVTETDEDNNTWAYGPFEVRLNFPPTDITLSNNVVNENSLGAIIGSLSVTDPDPDDMHTFSVISDPSGCFEINSNTLKLKSSSSFDYESIASYDITIRVTDHEGLFYDKGFTINVLDGNDAPTDIILTSPLSTPEAKIIASDGAAGDRFGNSVSISGDYAVVGASDSAYIFKRNGTDWAEEAKLAVSDNSVSSLFVSISADYAIVGAPDSTYIFKRNETDWTEKIKLAVSDYTASDYYASSVSISSDYAAVGASGSAYIFKRNGTDWIEEFKLTASDGAESDFFASSVSISGDYAIVGTRLENLDSGSAYIFKRNGTDWTEKTELAVSDNSISSLTVSISADYAIVGASDSAYIFKRNETDWTDKTKLILPDNEVSVFSVSISSNYAVVEASGSAYIFKRDESSWAEQAKLTSSYIAASISSVSISGDYVIIGYSGDNDNGYNSGSAYIYDINYLQPDVKENSLAGILVGTTTGDDPEDDVLSFSLQSDPSNNFEIIDDSGTWKLQVASGATLDYETAQSHDITIRTTDPGGLFYEEGFRIKVIDRNEDGIIFVDKDATGGADTGFSWDDAYMDIHSVLPHANPGAELWVAEGVYLPSKDDTGDPSPADNRTKTFKLIGDVALYGGFIGNGIGGNEDELEDRQWTPEGMPAYITELSGDLNEDDDPTKELVDPLRNNSENAYTVVTGADYALLDGFVITGGNANVGRDYWDDSTDTGGGMENRCSYQAVINCAFSNNYAKRGGGMSNFKYYDSVTYEYRSNFSTIINCTFNNNYAEKGGGIYNQDGGGGDEQSSPIIMDCRFDGNNASHSGGGIYNVGANLNPRITNCVFINNSALMYDGGGMINYAGSSPTITNCIFNNNFAWWWGGGICNQDHSNPIIINCTFSANQAQFGSELYNSDYSTPIITNSILWNSGSSGNTVLYNDHSTPTISYSDIQGCGSSGAGWDMSLGIDDGGNIDVDPLFANPLDPAGPDGLVATFDDGLRLTLLSPCIDMGDDSALPPDTSDLDGDLDILEDIPIDIIGFNRILGSTVDMGAYEINTLPGDINGDDTVNLDDFVLLRNAFVIYNAAADIDNDDAVNLTDFVILRNHFGENR